MIDTAFWSGAGLSGILVALTFWLRIRTSREKRADDMFEKVMTRVHAENEVMRGTIKLLQSEVIACHARDARVLVVENCVRVMVPELLRIDSTNMSLVHVALLLRSIEAGGSDGEWLDLLSKIDAADRLEGTGNVDTD